MIKFFLYTTTLSMMLLSQAICMNHLSSEELGNICVRRAKEWIAQEDANYKEAFAKYKARPFLEKEPQSAYLKKVIPLLQEARGLGSSEAKVLLAKVYMRLTIEHPKYHRHAARMLDEIKELRELRELKDDAKWASRVFFAVGYDINSKKLEN